MGYRSKVIVGVKKGKLSNQFDEILKKHDFQLDQPHTDHLVVGEIDEYKTYTFDYIKWYHDDEWCREIMLFLEKKCVRGMAMCVSIRDVVQKVNCMFIILRSGLVTLL